MVTIPEPPKLLGPNTTEEDYHDLYRQLARKYVRRDRSGKPMSRDPEELNELVEKGYKIKAERFLRRRD